jgi:4-hydroxybenzoate polyprenyltransferase
LPYTGIVTCFAAWGSLSASFEVERLVAICVIYFLSVGVCAHCLDAVGGKTRPWGELPKRKLAAVGVGALGIAFAIGLYYAFLDSPLLFPIGIAEGFFLFAYNLELFGGRFHNNASTVLSWGILPVFAGSAIQTNSISAETLVLAGISATITYVLIVTSRRYKELKRNKGDQTSIRKKEIVLKILALGVITATVAFFAVRYYF